MRWSDALSGPMKILLLLTIGHHAIGIWSMYTAWTHWASPVGLGQILLFTSGFAGIQLAFGILLVSSEEVRTALGFLLGVNGLVSALGWICLPILVFFVFGIAQFLIFSCFALPPREGPHPLDRHSLRSSRAQTCLFR